MEIVFMRACLLLFALSISVACSGQIDWSVALGGTSADVACCVIQTVDGGYAVAGSTTSADGDVTGQHGGSDLWLVKLSVSGAIQWQKTFGGSGDDECLSVVQTADNGFVLAGSTTSDDGDVTGRHGREDFWVVKVSSTGSLQWQKCFGGSGYDVPACIRQTTDNGYILTGVTTSDDGDITDTTVSADLWLVKISATGSLQWQRTLGGSGPDNGYAVRQVADGGYIVAGSTVSDDGDVAGHHHGAFANADCWVVKTSASGNIEWQKCIGGNDYDELRDILIAADSGYVLAGFTSSIDGDITGANGYQDVLLVKLSRSGTVEWQRCYGGTGDDAAYSVRQANDGGYVVAGHTSSNDGIVADNHGGKDYWVVKTDASGMPQWSKCLGGSGDDIVQALCPAIDGGWVAAGVSGSADGDIHSAHGEREAWVVKIGNGVGVRDLAADKCILYPNPATDMVCLNGLACADMQVEDIWGRVVSRVKNSDRVSLGHLRTGLYVVKVFVNGCYMGAGKVVKR